MSLKLLLLFSMSRILTGIQSTGTPHLGNILGAIIPAIEESKKNKDSYLFIADLHSLTQIKNAEPRGHGDAVLLRDGQFRGLAVLLS